MIEICKLMINRTLEQSEFTTLCEYVSDHKRKQIHRLIRYSDAQKTLLGDILARSMICKRLGVENSQLVFNRNQFGKPVISSFHDIHFNISHSGDMIVCAVGRQPLGVDMEWIQPINLDVSKFYFSLDERNMLYQLPEEQRLKYFYTIWTLKESYVKAEGVGMSMPLRDSTFVLRGNKAWISPEEMNKGYMLRLHEAEDGYIMATCSRSICFSLGTTMNIDQLLMEFFSYGKIR